MKLPEAVQTTLYEDYWSRIESLFLGSESIFDAFARDYIALKNQVSKQEKANEIYYAFRSAFPGLSDNLGGLENALADMLRFARYYAAFSLGRGVIGNVATYLARVRHLVEAPAILIIRLYECHDRLASLSEQQFREAMTFIESYVLRRAICGYQTRNYWQIFANLAYKINDESPLTDLKVELARLRESYRFPTDDEFERGLKEGDLYGLRVCRYLLDRLENHNTKEPTDTSGYSIEHIMPQNEPLPPPWRQMLGDDWKEVHKTWLHRLGNLTLTGYNSKYSDRPFEEKKTIEGGFSESSVRLNKFVREQPVWTAIEIAKRTNELARHSLSVWPPLVVEQSLIKEANRRDMREMAARRDVSKVKMSAEAKTLFSQLRRRVLELDSEVLELAEANSVSYHGPTFFLEVLPRRYSLTLLLALEFNQVDDPPDLAQDATQWKFFVHAKHEGGVSLSVNDEKAMETAMPIIRQAHAASCG